jgi:hypothetical protein
LGNIHVFYFCVKEPDGDLAENFWDERLLVPEGARRVAPSIVLVVVLVLVLVLDGAVWSSMPSGLLVRSFDLE